MDSDTAGPAIVVSLADAHRLGPPPEGQLSHRVFTRDDFEVEWYAPVGSDPQEPHDRDEIYVVASGRAVFFDGESRHDVGPGAFIFVPAWREHRFEDIGPGFGTWVAFFGPTVPELPPP
jgi:mannose-6-phosphate isomerase-like protein (cupin superfamily)